MVANHLVDEKLAACVNMIPGIRSVYRWQGEVESSNEVLLVIKTMEHAYQRVEETILKHHPSELPEILSVPINNGESGYLAWLAGAVVPVKQ